MRFLPTTLRGIAGSVRFRGHAFHHQPKIEFGEEAVYTPCQSCDAAHRDIGFFLFRILVAILYPRDIRSLLGDSIRHLLQKPHSNPLNILSMFVSIARSGKSK